MALSMDEQRMLAEIERRLSAEDPRLAARLSSFRRPGPTSKMRSPRGRIVGTLFTVALVAVVSLMVYAMVPFRAHIPRTTSSPQASTSQGISASARPGQSSGTAAARDKTTAKPSTVKSGTAKTSTAKTAARSSAAKAGSGAASGHDAATTGTSATTRTRVAPSPSHT